MQHRKCGASRPRQSGAEASLGVRGHKLRLVVAHQGKAFFLLVPLLGCESGGPAMLADLG